MLLISSIFTFLLRLKISFLTQAIGMICYTFRFIFIFPINYSLIDFFNNKRIYLILNIVTISIGYLILLANGYIHFKLGFSAKFKIFEKGTLERIMRVSNSIDLEILRDILKMDEKGERRQINRLKKLRKERIKSKVEKSLDRLRKAAEGDENLMPYILDAAKAYATLGEICDVMREVFGEYEEPPTF